MSIKHICSSDSIFKGLKILYSLVLYGDIILSYKKHYPFFFVLFCLAEEPENLISKQIIDSKKNHRFQIAEDVYIVPTFLLFNMFKITMKVSFFPSFTDFP